MGVGVCVGVVEVLVVLVAVTAALAEAVAVARAGVKKAKCSRRTKGYQTYIPGTRCS